MAMILRNSNIVLLGGFNPLIIQPVWLSNHDVVEQKGDKFTADIQVGEGLRHLRFVLDEMQWDVAYDRILLGSAKKQSPAPWLSRMLEKLPHTPVRAVGINFQFTCPTTDCILPISCLSKHEAAQEKVGTVRSSALVTRAEFDDGTQLTLTLTTSEPENVVDANFHRAVSDVEMAKKTMLEYDSDFERAASLVSSVSGMEVSIDDNPRS